MSLSIHTLFVLFGLKSRHASFIVAHYCPSHGTFFSVCARALVLNLLCCFKCADICAVNLHIKCIINYCFVHSSLCSDTADSEFYSDDVMMFTELKKKN